MNLTIEPDSLSGVWRAAGESGIDLIVLASLSNSDRLGANVRVGDVSLGITDESGRLRAAEGPLTINGRPDVYLPPNTSCFLKFTFSISYLSAAEGFAEGDRMTLTVDAARVTVPATVLVRREERRQEQPRERAVGGHDGHWNGTSG